MQITSHLFLLMDYFYRIVHINCLVLSKLATNVSSKSWISSVRRQMSNPVQSCTRVTRKVSPLNVSECPIACCNSFLPLMEISQNHFIAIATMPILPISIEPSPVCPTLLPWHDSGRPTLRRPTLRYLVLWRSFQGGGLLKWKLGAKTRFRNSEAFAKSQSC